MHTCQVALLLAAAGGCFLWLLCDLDVHLCVFATTLQIEAAREIASTVSQSANRVYLPAESLLLNLVGQRETAMSSQCNTP
jgi:hypothetical protein